MQGGEREYLRWSTLGMRRTFLAVMPPVSTHLKRIGQGREGMSQTAISTIRMRGRTRLAASSNPQNLTI